MTVPFDFYSEQAAKCARSAAEATLDNQRETFLRSEKAWQVLADRTAATAAARAAREANAGSAPAHSIREA